MPVNDPEAHHYTIIEGEGFWVCPLHRGVLHYSRALLLKQSIELQKETEAKEGKVVKTDQ